MCPRMRDQSACFDYRNNSPVQNRTHSACSQVTLERVIKYTFAEPCPLTSKRQ